MQDAMVLFLLAAAWGLFATVMWFLNWRVRRQLHDRMWGIAAAQGIPVASMTGEVSITHHPLSDNRVQQLESQVDQMAQQIDRIAESQEFLSRVLTDRIDQLPDPRLRTPH